MYRLHIANKNYSSWSLRPWILMTEFAIPFRECVSPFSGGSNWEVFRDFSPSGLVPCLVDGSRKIWDSLAIVEYLAEMHKGIWPDDIEARAWARCASSEMHSGFSALRNICPMNCGVEVALGNVPQVLEKDLARMDELWQEGLAQFGGPFLAGGQFTAVDAFFAPVAFRVRSYNLQLSEAAMKYIHMLLGLDSMEAWESAALLEPWREPGHEEQTKRYGTIIVDKRKV